MQQLFNGRNSFLILGAILLLLGIVFDAIDIGDIVENIFKGAGAILLIIGLVKMFGKK